MTGIDYRELVKCRKPDCMRKVKPSVAYCCRACSNADGERKFELEPYIPGAHWIHCHSQDCEARSAERGECDWWEAIALEQRP